MILLLKLIRSKYRHSLERDGLPPKSLGSVSVSRQVPKCNAIGGTLATCEMYTPDCGARATGAASPSTVNSPVSSVSGARVDKCFPTHDPAGCGDGDVACEKSGKYALVEHLKIQKARKGGAKRR